jgi:hypothetical protein
MNVSCALLAVALLPLSMAASDATTTAQNTPAQKLTAAEVVDKCMAASGGLDAWRALQTLEMKGEMEAGGNQRSTLPARDEGKVEKIVPSRPKNQALLPFVMDLERGRKVRIELQFKGQTAVQVYNGAIGWKLRPFLNRHDVEEFTPDELKTASSQPDLDGFLVDYAAKGLSVDLEGTDEVDGNSAYKLKVTDKAGNVRHVWVDSKTFLESKIEGVPRRLDGKNHPVAVYLSDYKSVNGLMMPYSLETRVDGVRDTEKVKIDSIVSNLKLDESRFGKPN